MYNAALLELLIGKEEVAAFRVIEGARMSISLANNRWHMYQAKGQNIALSWKEIGMNAIRSVLVVVLLLTMTSSTPSEQTEEEIGSNYAEAIGFYAFQKREADHFFRLHEMTIDELLLYRKVLNWYGDLGRVTPNQMVLIDRLTKGTYNLTLLASVHWGSNEKAKSHFEQEIMLVDKLQNEPDIARKMAILGTYQWLRLQKKRELIKPSQNPREKNLMEMHKLVYDRGE